jgi:hypothetical protein
MEITTITGPAHLASALINGDLSGMEPDDLETLRGFEKYADGYEIIDAPGEPYFSWSCDLYGATYRGGDLIDYTAIRRVDS